MPHELDSRYDHKAIEHSIYKKWEESGYFNPDRVVSDEGRVVSKKKSLRRSKLATRNSPLETRPFSIIMPPPNANGSLHLGHAVFVTLQDIMARYHRMKGNKTLWLPGADHAGFETQVVFNKKLEKEGRSWFSMNREELYREIWNFTQANKKLMEQQLRKLGASCDWSREKFTLDPDIVRIVYDTFGRLYKDGLIERDAGLVNWCPKHQTSLSDLEIKDEERADPFYYLRYGPFTIGTARPETKFGDKYVVMHPDDARYKEYKDGEQFHLEWINGPLTATILKDKAVDKDFGSGVMTITPWHDPVDFELAKRRNLDKEQIIDERGRLLSIAGEFEGMKITEARPKIVEKLQSKGLVDKVDEAYRHVVRACYKCGTLIEPQIKSQWFVRMNKQIAKSPAAAQAMAGKKKQRASQSLAEMAVRAVKERKIKFYPEHAKKVFLHWLRNLRDWNISRQIVWGIRIPAWFCASCGEVRVMNPLTANPVRSRAYPAADGTSPGDRGAATSNGTKWLLVRHGETEWNKEERAHGHADPPLNNEGRAYAESLAARLKERHIGIILTSDLSRARETAEIVARATGAELIVSKGLRGRHIGIAQGMHHRERRRLYGDIFQSYEDAPPGGESFKDFEERVWNAFRQHHALYRHKNVAVVTHIETIHAILKRTKNWDMKQMIAHQTEKAGFTEFDILDPCPKCKNDLYEQDPDVFDTWFSSGQWPYATLLAGREKRGSSKLEVRGSNIPPRSSNDFQTFYPTDVLETAGDILFFWVARMVMFGLYRTGEIPFRNVYLHGLVRDKDRQKMSKSKDNVIDPLGVAEEYGTDAVRMALVAGNTAGNDTIVSEDKIRGYRNFATKVWNIARFVLMHKTGSTNYQSPITNYTPKLTATDKKFLVETKKIKTEVGRHIERFEFHLAAEKAYHYIWHTFADKVVEHYKDRWPKEGEKRKQTKRTLERQAAASYTLENILANSLTMLHPFMPFVTEAIYKKLKPEEMLMVKPWRE
ncbi:MAG: class I tRNA ligase family protein [Candidatus Liptonbacteria bacterium]|nr:class I tRNA ligase family protein [Candidatus Liptonbacteria bacterium]